MADTVSTSESKGLFSRLMESIRGVLFGMALFMIGFPVLFVNEIRAVVDWHRLQSGRAAVVEIQPDAVDAAHEGALVYTSSRATTDEVLKDVQFGLAENAIRLRRSVEMYQWTEHKEKETVKKVGGGEETVTTYTYTKDWDDDLNDSSDFEEPEGHRNPSQMPFEGQSVTAKNVTVGAFNLSGSLVNQVDSWEDIKVDETAIGKLPASLQGQAKAHNGGIYLGTDPSSPAIGDARIAFEVVRPTVVSVVAGQKNAGLDNWDAPPLGGAAGVVSGIFGWGESSGSIAMLQVGDQSVDEVFSAAEATAQMITWVVRFAGWLMMFVGIGLIVRPFTVLADVIPFVGSIVRMGASVVGFFVSAVLAIGVIALGWIAIRPILGGFLCLVSFGLFAGMIGLAVTLARRSAAKTA